MNPLTQSKNTTILPVLIALTLGCFGLLPQARAVCQEGCDLSNGNTFLGDDALISNTTGFNNTALGSRALTSNTWGFYNTAVGWEALESNPTGGFNTGTGAAALWDNTSGDFNTANGAFALARNTTGDNNTASGTSALTSSSTGSYNTATGAFTLQDSTGENNTATGALALLENTTGNSNTAIGYSALSNNTTGSNNIAVGADAGDNLTGGHSNIAIGNAGVARESKTIRIGTTGIQDNAYMAGISGVTVPGGVGVIVGNNGKLGTTTSSARFKEAIKPMDKASEAILALKPVTFSYKKELDPDGIPQFGLVAEDVEKVNPALVARDADGKAYTVRYDAVNAMLLNEFLKEHRKVEQQRKDFEAAFAQQQKQIEALTVGLQKVSAQLEASRRAQQTVVSNP